MSDSVFGPRMPRELDQDERAALVWLSSVDGFKMAKVLTRETLLVVYANLVAAGQYREAVSVPVQQAHPGEGEVPRV